MSKISRATSEKKYCLFFLIESDNVTLVMLCPVTQSNWGGLTVAPCDICKDTLAAFAAALSVLSHISPVAATWAHCDKGIFVLYLFAS